MNNKGDYFCFLKLGQFPGLIQAVSSRRLGDMTDKNEKHRKKHQADFLSLFGLTLGNLILTEQVHGNKIELVGKNCRGQLIQAMRG